jgi:Na+/proline symporter
VGTGKFLAIFLPFPPFVCAMIMISITLLYTTLGGLLGVVYTGLLQAALIGFSIVFISVKAFLKIDARSFRAIVPAGWGDIVPPWRMNLPSGYDMYNLFGISVIFFFLKTVIEGMGAPGGYMAQRYFASKSDRDSGYLSALWVFLLSFRWPFIVGAAVLGLSLGAGVAEPETALPTVIVQLIPAGLKGLLISALIAAEMSTFDATVNAAASYMVNDIYFKYISPRASQRQLVRAGYFSSVLIVFLGVLAGSLSPSINAIWGWMTMSLVAGMIMPNFLRWYWWRFNGSGFAVGTGTGILAALVQKLAFPGLHEWQAFLAVVSASLIGMITATFLTAPTDEKVLVHFFVKTRPIGFWKKITRKLDAGQARLISIENRWDMTAVLFAVPWQISLFLAPVFLVIHDWKSFAAFLTVNGITAAGLYFTWFRRLSRNNGTENAGPRDFPIRSLIRLKRRKNDL